jgi:predicted RNA-binding Zn ribbon-like protein
VVSSTKDNHGLGVADVHLCLDFINTEGVERNSPPDRLENLGLFLDWASERDLLDAGSARALSGEKGVDGFLKAACDLREALYRIFAALVRKDEPAAADLTTLDRHLSEVLPSLHLVRRAGEFEWQLAESPAELAHLLWPIALSASDLLRSDRLDRVKECGGETCSWMFIDESRNRSRRWCDMSDCGNRAKAKRFYRRHSGRE